MIKKKTGVPLPRTPKRKHTLVAENKVISLNILDKMPKSVQGKAKQLIHEMYLAPTRKAALAACDQFISSYQTKFLKACECLEKDKEVLFTLYDFPAQHWPHLRTTNPIESTFATVRIRTQRTKGSGSRIATLTMVFKLEAQKRWHFTRVPERWGLSKRNQCRFLQNALSNKRAM